MEIEHHYHHAWSQILNLFMVGEVKVSGECMQLAYPLPSVEPDIIILVVAVAVLLFWATNM